LIEALGQLALEKGITASQLAMAWVLAKSPTIVPVIGARTRAQLAESLDALHVELSAADNDTSQMQMLDSEGRPQS